MKSSITCCFGPLCNIITAWTGRVSEWSSSQNRVYFLAYVTTLLLFRRLFFLSVTYRILRVKSLGISYGRMLWLKFIKAKIWQVWQLSVCINMFHWERERYIENIISFTGRNNRTFWRALPYNISCTSMLLMDFPPRFDSFWSTMEKEMNYTRSRTPAFFVIGCWE